MTAGKYVTNLKYVTKDGTGATIDTFETTNASTAGYDSITLASEGAVEELIAAYNTLRVTAGKEAYTIELTHLVISQSV
jgi:hypothetical protein